MKASVRRVVGGGLMILGGCALVTACLFALLAWGGSPGSWPIKMPSLVRELEFDMAISAAIGVVAIALGFWLHRLKGDSEGGR